MQRLFRRLNTVESINRRLRLSFRVIVLILVVPAIVSIASLLICATARAGLSYVLVYAEPVLTLCLLAFMPGLMELGVWLAVPAAQVITFAAAVIIKRRLG